MPKGLISELEQAATEAHNLSPFKFLTHALHIVAETKAETEGL